ncbi:MAG: PPC domain-containing DNA-binding protein [Succiniclasticum sp.]|jgi:predicted DNA-binding protein with PD1-like motif
MEELTIPRGQDILPALERYVLDRGWDDVVVVHAIGSVKDLLFACPVEDELPLRVAVTPCHGAAEILSFTGEIMTKEKMDPELEAVYPDRESPLFVHIHASCARAGGQVMGGGLRGGKAFRSLRVFLRPVQGS